VFRIVAHRGLTSAGPENTMAAFAGALEIGVDAIELDVRLTRDRRPIVHHDSYLNGRTSGSGPIFDRTAAELRGVHILDAERGLTHPVPTLEDVLRTFAGKIGLEIELKGPEPEAADVVGNVLARFRDSWDRIEVTSFEPALLSVLRAQLGDVTTALLFPPSEPWMREDIVAYAALNRARLARANAVHLHPDQLSEAVVASIRMGGVDVHSHSVNDERSLELAVALEIPWICSDQPERAVRFRRRRLPPSG
jgi:glycerophosphoryl diester phosphodiesterase